MLKFALAVCASTLSLLAAVASVPAQEPNVADANLVGTNLVANMLPASVSKTTPKAGPQYLTDGDPTSVWGVYHNGGVEIVYRFKEPVAARNIVLANAVPAGGSTGSTANLVTVWASHQSFGEGFFKLGRAELPTTGVIDIEFGETIKFRSIKLILERGTFDKQSRSNSSYIVRLAEITLPSAGNPDTVSRRPMPVLAPMAGLSDPLQQGSVTQCDDIAGLPFNPDSYGHFRVARDISVPEALDACNRAVASNPASARLQTNLARIEIMAERFPQAIARLTEPLVADYAPAKFLLAELYENGNGVARNKQQARELFEFSAKLDHGPSLFWLAIQAIKQRGIELAKGEKSETTNPIDPNLQRSVDLGYIPAYSTYFTQAMHHKTIPVVDAYRLLEEAAEFGNKGGVENYAVNLSNGYRINSQRRDAKRYDRQMALRNSTNSMANYVSGESGDLILYWLRRSAYSGAFWPIENLVGKISNAKRKKALAGIAFKSAMKSATAGDHWSMEWLARYYERGFGVPKDAEQSRVWRCRARTLGNPVALVARVTCTGDE